MAVSLSELGHRIRLAKRKYEKGREGGSKVDSIKNDGAGEIDKEKVVKVNPETTHRKTSLAGWIRSKPL